MKNYGLVKLSETSLAIQLYTDRLSEQEQKGFFGKTYSEITCNEKIEFIQEEDFVFEPDLLLSLGIDTRYSILKKGKYPLHFLGNLIIVVLELSRSLKSFK
ncbi:hypothetical protein [Flavobacterium suncheonense]|uniref:Uncharacterized protein n=1 Tax=Flavobacterium suncheonense GH29-5 = DSM 17707 TaxID=1121899 RepID=A0A0A2MAA2_9FLAO|nr:hypothetical protein [Flavobacterium suncheonense]KGO89159.1 hypothetical protein Q764_08790 [Flavobacterium suncheonense GH29-5 = DSM 17707]